MKKAKTLPSVIHVHVHLVIPHAETVKCLISNVLYCIWLGINSRVNSTDPLDNYIMYDPMKAYIKKYAGI